MKSLKIGSPLWFGTYYTRIFQSLGFLTLLTIGLSLSSIIPDSIHVHEIASSSVPSKKLLSSHTYKEPLQTLIAKTHLFGSIPPPPPPTPRTTRAKPAPPPPPVFHFRLMGTIVATPISDSGAWMIVDNEPLTEYRLNDTLASGHKVLSIHPDKVILSYDDKDIDVILEP
jgi:hypothetical protein